MTASEMGMFVNGNVLKKGKLKLYSMKIYLYVMNKLYYLSLIDFLKASY